MPGTSKKGESKNRWRFGLRSLLLAPLVLGALMVLARPTLLTGHFCYVTVDELRSSRPGAFRVKYRYCLTPNTTFRMRATPGGGAGSSSRGGLFSWHRRSNGACGGGMHIREGLVSDMEAAKAIKLRPGHTYRVPLNGELVVYELRHPETGEMIRGVFSFYENDKAPDDRWSSRGAPWSTTGPRRGVLD